MDLPCSDQRLQALPHQVAGLRVQPGGGFVQQQQLGVVHQRTRQAQPPAHAARQFAGFGIGLVGQCRKFQQLGNASPDSRILHAEIATVDQQILGTAEVGVEGVKLGDHAELFFDLQGVLGHAQGRGGLAIGTSARWKKLNLAPIRHGQPQAHADGGGFAGAIGANHAQAFAGGDVERHLIHHRGIAITLAQIFGLKQGLCHIDC